MFSWLKMQIFIQGSLQTFKQCIIKQPENCVICSKKNSTISNYLTQNETVKHKKRHQTEKCLSFKTQNLVEN